MGSFYTVSTLARELAVSEKTIRRAIKSGALRTFRIGQGRIYRISIADAQEWLGSRRDATD